MFFKTVIVGGSGWAAVAAESLLVDGFKVKPSEISIYGSYSRKVVFASNRIYQVGEWTPVKEKFKPTLFLPFGFLTVDKYSNRDGRLYIEECRRLISKSVEYIELNQPEMCFLLSSGIVMNSLEFDHRDKAYFEYAKMKLEEEEAIKEICKETKTRLVICRLFSASGKHMSKYRDYALGNFIFQAIQNKNIIVRRSGLVYRKYVDMSQLIEVGLREVAEQTFLCFESSGDLIELGDLAYKVSNIFSVSVSCSNAKVGCQDNYYSTTRDTEELAAKHGIQLFDLETQIDETVAGIRQKLRFEI